MPAGQAAERTLRLRRATQPPAQLLLRCPPWSAPEPGHRVVAGWFECWWLSLS